MNFDNLLSNNLIIFVEGNISTGKGKFINDFTKFLISESETRNIGKFYSFTSATNNVVSCNCNIFDLFACSPEKWTAEYFMFNITQKLAFIKEHAYENNSILIVERSFLTESTVFIKSLYQCNLICEITYSTCINLANEISDIIINNKNRFVCYIYLKTDPNDLFDNIMTNNSFESLNYKLLENIHKNYDIYFKNLESNQATSSFIKVDLPYEQMFKPSLSTIKSTFKQLQKHYPIFQHN